MSFGEEEKIKLQKAKNFAGLRSRYCRNKTENVSNLIQNQKSLVSNTLVLYEMTILGLKLAF